MFTRRGWLQRACALALLAGLLGLACAPAAPSSTGQQSAPTGQQVTLRLWIAGPNLEDYLKEVVPAFEKATPGVKVEWITMDWTQYQQKILTGVAGGAPPDVISFFSVDVAPWATQGVLAPVDAYIQRGDWVENALDNGVWDGKAYALPWGMQLRALFYRKDLLKEAGYDRPPQTWDELEAYAQKLVKRDTAGNVERVGFWIPTSHPYKTIQMWLAFLWNNGGEMFDAAGKKATFNGPEGVEATQFLADLLTKYKVDTAGSIKTDNTDFFQGKVAMLVSNIVQRNLLRDAPQLKDVTGVAIPPYKKKPVIEMAGQMVGVTQASKSKDAAAKLLLFLTANKDNVAKHDQTDDLIPGYKPALETDYARTNPWLQQYQPLVQYGRPLPKHPKWTEVSAVVTAALDEVYLKGKPAKQALDEAAAKVNDIIK